MNVLLGSVCEAGLNKGRIMDSLAQVYEYDGVTGHMVFDTNSKNIAPMYLARVHNGTIEYRPTSMEPKTKQSESKSPPPSAAPLSETAPPKSMSVPYARVGEDGVSFSGPSEDDLATGEVRIAVFGPHADQLVRAPEAVKTTDELNAGGKHVSLIGI